MVKIDAAFVYVGERNWLKSSLKSTKTNKEIPMHFARRLVHPLSRAILGSRRMIVPAIILLLIPVILLACGAFSNSSSNSSPNGNGCPTPPSVATAVPGQRFKIGQQINVSNQYVIRLDSAEITMGYAMNGKGTPVVSGFA